MADKVTTSKAAVKKEETAAEKIQGLMDQLREALVEAGQEPNTVDAHLYGLRIPEVNVVGNLADLQRMGALAAKGEDSSMAAAQEAAPSAPAPPEA
jgi:hypothetical protein